MVVGILGCQVVFAGTSFEECVNKSIESNQKTVDISENINVQDAINKFYRIVNANADYWYVNDNVKCLGTSNKVSKLQLAYDYTEKEIEEGNSLIEKNIDDISEGAMDLTSDYEKVKYVYDYMISKYDYDDSHLNTRSYDLIKDKKGTCTAFASVFKSVMDKLGVECEVVFSYEISHCWNIVKVDNEWYNIDVSGGVVYNKADVCFKYDCFLKSDSYYIMLGYGEKEDNKNICLSSKFN